MIHYAIILLSYLSRPKSGDRFRLEDGQRHLSQNNLTSVRGSERITDIDENDILSIFCQIYGVFRIL